MSRPALAALALVACIAGAQAQEMPDMDMGAMPGTDHHTTPAAPAPTGAGQEHTPTGHDAMPMPADEHQPMHGATAPAQHHHATAKHDPSAPMHHDMGPMQGGNPPPDARDPDYSDGLHASPMHGIDMAMGDDPRFATLHVDRLEAVHTSRGDGQQWEVQGGYGNSRDKLWLRSEGERSGGRLGTADVELLWQHAVASFWDTQLGVRTDTGGGPGRQWVAFGIQGLAPYWFELEATGYIGPAGRTAARLRADYELLFTQRLVLQPELELNAYGKADPARHLGSGLSDIALGLRLRYEIRREVAPYVGGVWTRRFGSTAAHDRSLFEWQWVAGVRIRL
ncbi:copper resistance protein B [Frateuria sp. GZRR35]|uniref:copper resistance protein B n=1 Tax=Frateuria sp. GZRR35 TaxID=3351536 RepID=UPI003EDBB182